jgi:hypothetical protein
MAQRLDLPHCSMICARTVLLLLGREYPAKHHSRWRSCRRMRCCQAMTSASEEGWKWDGNGTA